MSKILVPGKNCQGIYQSRRAGLIIDGRNYYSAFFHAASRARHYIMIAGWQFDSDVLLLRGEDGKACRDDARFTSFLNRLCERNRNLEIYILAWDFSALYLADREWFQKWIFTQKTNDRIHFRFDSKHAFGASHHQKFVVIDGIAAFAGGMDICSSRWDDRRHLSDNAFRVNSNGQSYEPYHDIQSYIVGPVALQLRELFCSRWKKAGGGGLRPGSYHGNYLDDIDVSLDLNADGTSISRTQSRTLVPFKRNIREIRSLYIDAISSAEQLIYMENQYFSSQAVLNALMNRMKATGRSKLNIVIILPQKPHSVLEEIAMGATHIKMIRLLRRTASETGHALGIYYTMAEPPEKGGSATYIHAKIMIIDNRFLTAGSANASNRSMGLDTELNIAWEADGKTENRLVTDIRNARTSLLSEHTGLDGEQDRKAFSENEGLVPYLDSIAQPGKSRLRKHSLKAFTEKSEWLYSIASENLTLDPEKPVIEENIYELMSRDKTGFFAEGVTMLQELLSGQKKEDQISVPEKGTRKGLQWIKFISILATAAIAYTAWRAGIADIITLENLKGNLDALRSYISERYVLSAVLFICMFMLTAFFIPGTIVMTIAAGALFGVIKGTVLVISGGTTGASAAFLLSRYVAGNWIQRRFARRLRRLNIEMSRHGHNYLLFVRIIPIAPFFLINFFAGLTRISIWTFIWTTAAGMLPGSLVYTFAGHEIGTIESTSDIMSWRLMSAFMLLALFTLLPVFRRLYDKLRNI